MESKKVAFTEQLLSPRRKVLSGFSLCIGASLLLLVVILINSSLRTPLAKPVFQGFSAFSGSNASIVSWPFSFSSTSSFSETAINTTASASDARNIHAVRAENNFSMEVQNGSLTGENTGPNAIVPKIAENRNFSVFSGEEVAHLRSFSGMAVHEGSFTEEGEAIAKVRAGKNVNSKKAGTVQSPRRDGNDKSGGEQQKLLGTNDEGSFIQGKNAPISYYDSQSAKMTDGSFKECDIFDGRWIRDYSKPYYPPGSCPHVDRDFNCQLNGRPDEEYMRWRWKPNGCEIPSLDAADFLERLRGKKLVFVGDSLNRNMWESLVCILRHNIKNKQSVYEISGRREFKKKGFYAFRFEDYNCTVDFVAAPFLVRQSVIKGKNGALETLKLDRMDWTTSMYQDADIIIFNTGHWWTHEKTSRGEDYYQEGNHIYRKLKVLEAYKRALKTWARWVDNNIDGNRTQVFFRGYSATHFRGGQWNSGGQCHKEVEPIFNDRYLGKYPSKMKVLEHVLLEMKTPVIYLNVSKLTDYRKDGHPSIYRTEYRTEEERAAAEQAQDCSHWCLPGVPDTWNELLYASLLKAGRGSWRS